MRDLKLFVSALLIACGPSGRDGDGGGGGGGGGGGVQPDASGGGGGSGGGETIYVYAHSPSTLYRVDPDNLSVQMVGNFGWGSIGSDQMTDIAIDKHGNMIGVSYSRVYKVDPTSAATTLLSSSLSGSFNGLSFVPADMLGQTGEDVLVGTQNSDGKVFRIDPMTGGATEVGNMGAFTSSGDLVSVAGYGTVQTVLGPTTDKLAKLAPVSFSASPIGAGTGYAQIWGVAYWKSKVFGFTNGGQFVLIDPTSGAAMLVQQTPGINWWGAAVTTLAPVLQ